MELQAFVKQALVDLMEAVRAAQSEVQATGGMIAPQTMAGSTTSRATSGLPIHTVEFDIAVTASEESEKKKGVGILVAAIGLGAEGQTSITSSVASRIKFSVPITWPNPSGT